MNPKLIISAGMPRAGSGWYYNLVHDLVVAGGGQNARSIRDQFHLQRFLTEVNCNISTLKSYRLFPVLFPALLGNKYVIKTHARPTTSTRWLLRRQRIKTTYIFRDPRAAMLSAYEYGRHGIKKDRPNAFSHLEILESAAAFIDFYVDIWDAWSKLEGVLIVRYEDFVADFGTESERLAEYLCLEIDIGKADRVFEQYRPEKGSPGRIGTHFSMGQPERFRRVFTPSQLEGFTKMFEPVLQRMGYMQ